MKKGMKFEFISIPSGIFPITSTKNKKNNDGISTNNKDSHFPSTIRELRTERGWSQQYVADSLGVTKTTIGLYELGQNIPDIKNLYKLSKLFNVSSDYLIGLSDLKSTNTKVHEVHEFTGLTEDAISFLNIIKENKSRLEVFSKLLSCKKFFFAIELLDQLEKEKRQYEKYSSNFDQALSDMNSDFAKLLFRNPGQHIGKLDMEGQPLEDGQRQISLLFYIDYLRQKASEVFNIVVNEVSNVDCIPSAEDILRNIKIEEHFWGNKYSHKKEE